MNKLYRKVLVSLVDEGMKARFPEFRHEKFDKHPLRRSSNRDFLWKPSEGIRIYVCIVPHPSGWDDFQCEIWWSRLDRYPEPVLKFYDPEHYHEDEGWVVLNQLGELPYAWKIERVNVPPAANLAEQCDDYRGLTEEEALQLIAPMVNEMLDALEQYGRPVIRDLAEVRKAAG